jgi:hypothetical protein
MSVTSCTFASILVTQGSLATKQLGQEQASIDKSHIYLGRNAAYRIKRKELTDFQVNGSVILLTTSKNQTFELINALDLSEWTAFCRKLQKLFDKNKLETQAQDFVRRSPNKALGAARKPRGHFGRKKNILAPQNPEWSEDELDVTVTKPSLQSTASSTSPQQQQPYSIQTKVSDADASDTDDEIKPIIKPPPKPIRRKLQKFKKANESEESSDDDDIFTRDLTTPATAQRLVSPRTNTIKQSTKQEKLPDKGQSSLTSFFATTTAKSFDPSKNAISPVGRQNSSLNLEQDVLKRSSPAKSPGQKLTINKRAFGTPTRLVLNHPSPVKSPSPKLSPSKRTFGTPTRMGSDHAARMFIVSKRKALRQDSNWLASSPARGKSSEDLARLRLNLQSPSVEDPILSSSPTTMSSPTQMQLQFQPRIIKRSRLNFKASERVSVLTTTLSPVVTTITTTTPKSIFRGLRNLGNTCYAAASLQMLFTAAPFIRSLNTAQGPLARAVVETSLQLSNVDSKLPVSPAAIKDAIDAKTDKFVGYEQRDAHEFLSDLVDGMHEELETEAAESSLHNLPTDDFRLSVQVCLECTSCGYTRHKEEMYRHLSLDICNDADGEPNSMNKASVEKSLANFFQPETREIKCEKCDEGQSASQTLRILSR